MSSKKHKKFSLLHFIVELLVRQPLDKLSWPREMKIAKTLISKCDNVSFWKSLKRMYLPSLAWFLTEDGKFFLNKEYKKFKLEIPPQISYNLEQDKVGEDIEVAEKPKSLMEFLK